MSDDGAWKEDTETHVLLMYLKMATDAGSESIFRATIKLIVEFVDAVDYLQEQGK